MLIRHIFFFCNVVRGLRVCGQTHEFVARLWLPLVPASRFYRIIIYMRAVGDLVPAHVFTAACGEGLVDQLHTFIISLYDHLTTTDKVHLHLLYSKNEDDEHLAVDARKAVSMAFKQGLLDRRRLHITAEQVVPLPWLVQRQEWRICAGLRFNIFERHPNMDAALYLDADVLVQASVHQLWDHLRSFNPDQSIGMAQEHERLGRWHKAAGRVFGSEDTGDASLGNINLDLVSLNSGVVLMNLTRARRSGLVEFVSNATLQDQIHDRNLASSIKGIYGHFADQDLLNFWLGTHRRQLYLLPCSWNVYVWDSCVDKSVNPSTAALLHGAGGIFSKTMPRYDLEPWAASDFSGWLRAIRMRYVSERSRLAVKYSGIFDMAHLAGRAGLAS